MSTSISVNKEQLIKWGKLLLKIVVSAACLWYISKKINFAETKEVLKLTNIWFLLLAVLSFCFSKALSSVRLNLYFKNINVQLSEKKNLQLYWLGMFYNIFLPGSISGDAYKVMRISSLYAIPYKKTTAAVLLDRFSGLIALVLIAAFFWFIVFKNQMLSYLVLGGAVLLIPVTRLGIKFFFPDFIRSFWPTFFWGFVVQVFQVVTMLCIVSALHIHTHQIEYLLLFLISSVVAVLPFTIGGLGARELVFYWGATYFSLDVHEAVMMSLLFYTTTLISSAFGFPFVFFDPLKDKSKSS